jgi:hypothetical protein
MGRMGNKDLEKKFDLSLKAEVAFRRAVAKVVREHALEGLPLAVWRNGEAVWIPAAEALNAKTRRALAAELRRRANALYPLPQDLKKK